LIKKKQFHLIDSKKIKAKQSMGEEAKNYFSLKKSYPDINSIIFRPGIGFKNLTKDAVFVIDTNTLLAPFNTGKKTIEEIRKTYTKLIKEDRLYIPAHALREFARNRSIKISELFSNIDKHLSSIPSLGNFEYPILGELEAYKNLSEVIDKIKADLKEYKKNLQELKSGITKWNWEDPVSSMYSTTFTAQIIIENEQEEEELLKEYKDRITNNFPPGNKDKAKEDNSIGDFLIWKVILELGKTKSKNIIFVSNDEKNDWMLKANKESISTRYELVDEFYRYTGFGFACMTFTDFLESQGVQVDTNEFENLTIPFTPSIEIDSRGRTIKYTESIQALKTVASIINDFISDSISPQDVDDLFIDNPLFEPSARHYMHNWRSEVYLTIESPIIYFDKLAELEILLDEIISLNFRIRYEHAKARMPTDEFSQKLIMICRNFYNLYLEVYPMLRSV
jgi:hypothetical protein